MLNCVARGRSNQQSGRRHSLRHIVRGTVAVSIVLMLGVLSGCRGLFGGSPLDGEGIARVTVAVPTDLDIADVNYRVTGGQDDLEGAMTMNGDNTAAGVDLALPAGSYEVVVELAREWTNETGNAIAAHSPPQPFTVTANRETVVEVADPLTTGTETLHVRADVSGMETEGLNPEIVGVWLDGIDTPNHYHFHAATVDGSLRTGSFDYVQPGEYRVSTVASNFTHSGWTPDQPWHNNVTAEQLGTITVESGPVTYEPVLIHSRTQDFSGNSEHFESHPGDGTVSISGGELILSGAQGDEVPMYRSVDAIVAEYLTIDFDIKLGPYDPDLDGDEAHAHINLLTGEPGDTRVLLVVQSGGVYLASIVEGVTRATTNVPLSGLGDDAYHHVRIAVKGGAVMVWVDGSISPVATHTYHPSIPEWGGFSFESHQPYRIDSLTLTRDVADALPEPEVSLPQRYTLYYRAEAADVSDERRLYRVAPADEAPVALTSADTGHFDVNPRTGELLASLDDGSGIRQAYRAWPGESVTWTQITSQDGSVFRPRWMNDGTHVVYSKVLNPDTGSQNLRWAARDGSDDQLLANTDTRDDFPAPFGTRLYYVTDPNWSPDGRIMELDTADATPTPVQIEGDDNRADQHLDVNREGSRMLVTTSENSTARYGDPRNIYLLDTETGFRRRLFDRADNESYLGARYSSDGRYIVYSYTEDYTAISSGDSSYDVYRADIDGSNVVRLTNTPEVNEYAPYLVVTHE